MTSPKTKHALNIHISKDEYQWLRERAKAEGLTLTMTVRLLMREQQDRERVVRQWGGSGKRG